MIGLSQEPTVFQPLKLHIDVDEAVYMSLFGTLWRSDSEGNFVPDLAARSDPGHLAACIRDDLALPSSLKTAGQHRD